MESFKYIDDINALPSDNLDLEWKKNFAEKIAKHKTENRFIEATMAAEFISRTIFNERNVPDELFEAYNSSFSRASSGGVSLYENYIEHFSRGEESVRGFVSNLKGKLFEMKLIPSLEESYPGFEFNIAENPINPIWDIMGINSETGEQILVQAKMGAASYASDVIERMNENPDVIFTMSEDLADKVLSIDPELADQIIDSGIDSSEFTEATEMDLGTLAGNLGIDIPDEVGELLPYATEMVLAVRFLFDIIKVNRDYKAVDASDKTRLYAFKLILLMSRFGVSSVCVPLGGIIGSAIPIPLLGTISGAIAGAWFASQVNKKLKPCFSEIALWLLRLSDDDLFYMRNKMMIDSLAESFLTKANAM